MTAASVSGGRSRSVSVSSLRVSIYVNTDRALAKSPRETSPTITLFAFIAPVPFDSFTSVAKIRLVLNYLVLIVVASLECNGNMSARSR